MMNYITTISNKLARSRDRRRRARALRKINKLRRFVNPLGDMRQFLYLDNIALRSLYVSRYGPEDARTTITDARTRDTELSSNTAYSIPGLPHTSTISASMGSTLRSGNAHTMQIELVASEQSLFRDFLDREASAGTDSQIWDGTPDATGKIRVTGRPFQRGELIQIRIRLQADLTYRISSFASAISDLAEGAPEMNFPHTADTLQIAEVLRQLLIDQAPIDAELIDWGWDPTRENLIPKAESKEPLRLVGLTQIDNYWIDVRRALFDGAECMALVRVSEDVPSENWSPLKLFDAIRGLSGFDNLDESINQLRAGFASPPAPTNVSLEPLTKALTNYLFKMASEEESENLNPQIKHIATTYAPSLPSASVISEAFNDIDRLLRLMGSPPADSNVIAEERAAALLDANLSTDGATIIGVTPEKPVSPPTPPTHQYIVGEIIALYW